MCVYSTIDIPYSIDIKTMYIYIYNFIQNYIRLYYSIASRIPPGRTDTYIYIYIDIQRRGTS